MMATRVNKNYEQIEQPFFSGLTVQSSSQAHSRPHLHADPLRTCLSREFS